MYSDLRIIQWLSYLFIKISTKVDIEIFYLAYLRKSILLEKQRGRMNKTDEATMVKWRFIYQVWQKLGPTNDINTENKKIALVLLQKKWKMPLLYFYLQLVRLWPFSLTMLCHKTFKYIFIFGDQILKNLKFPSVINMANSRFIL